ncbi:MAG TPA: hypothetical protein VK450_01005, partial [Methanomicrobiales archaeon]|nr:hypothetical protein [Methanomicrobiales archaeon]
MARLNLSLDPPGGEAPVITPPASGDLDVKLLKIQEEMDLLKTSIKKLLIDIRDRLNEKDNPFLHPGINYNSGNLFEDGKGEEEKTEDEAGEAQADEAPGDEAGGPGEELPTASKSVQE